MSSAVFPEPFAPTNAVIPPEKSTVTGISPKHLKLRTLIDLIFISLDMPNVICEVHAVLIFASSVRHRVEKIDATSDPKASPFGAPNFTPVSLSRENVRVKCSAKMSVVFTSDELAHDLPKLIPR